jgi:release factor glutamine methyltransferase
MSTEALGDFSVLAETTVQDAQRAIARLFQNAGFETPELDARFLIQGSTGMDAGRILAEPGQRLGQAAGALNDAVLRRLNGEPVSRILGKRWFYGREFEISADVLDPRPDTETVIEAALAEVDRAGWRDREIAIADIGTGSGALIITLLSEFPLARGFATDVSVPALQIARINAVRHGVAGRLEFAHTRNLGGGARHFDLIVSNPPYIPSPDIAGLAAEVRDFDPRLALDGGPDGLDIYREIASEISIMPGPAVVVLEFGIGQAEDVAEIMRARLNHLQPGSVRICEDLGGHQRCVALRIHL